MRAEITALRRSLIAQAKTALKLQTRILRTLDLSKLGRMGMVGFLLAFSLGLPAELFNITSVDLGPLHFKIGSESFAATGINQQINFQARLLNAAGAVVPDGNYNMQFKIYQDGNGVLGGGDETLKWTETRLNNSSAGVVVKNGYFSVNLGSVTAFGSSVDWNQDTLWLSLHIGGTNASCTPFSTCAGAETEMSPFKRLAANPYALNSGQLGGLTSGQFVQLAQGLQADSSTTNASIAINKTGGTANIMDLQRGGSSVLLIDNNGTATHQATGNNISLKAQQTANASPTTDIFNVLGANGTSKFIAVTSTAANQGSVTVQSLGSNALTLDSGAALNIGNTSATSVSIGRTRITTTNNGALTVTQQGTFNSSVTIAAGSTFTNASSSLFTSLAISNLPSGGAIGTAAATVDVATTFTVNQSTPNRTITVPSPTVLTAGRVIYLSNIGSASFTLLGAILPPGATANLVWNGTAWTYAGADGTSIANQNGSDQTADFRITGTGQANTSIITPLLKTSDVNGSNSAAIVLQSGDLGTGSGSTSGSVTIRSGNATQSNNSSGNIIIDAGTLFGSGTAGSISVGTTNASALTIGRTGVTTSNPGALSVGQALTGTTATFSAASALTLGTASTSTGSILFKGSGSANTLTLNGPTSPTTNTLTLPNETGTLCVQSASSCGFALSATNGYVQLAPSGSQTDSTTNSSIFLNKTGASGNILELEKNGTDQFVIANNGNITAAGTYNTNTFTSTALTFGGAGATVSTTSGDLTLQATGGNLIMGSNTTTLFKSGTAFTIDLNNASASTLNVTNSAAGAGNLSVETSVLSPLFDTPSGTTTLNIGTNNATVGISLNQNSTVAATKTLTVTSGLTSLTGNTTGDALNVSNSTSTGNIAVFKDGATNVAVIGDNGATTLTAIQPGSGNGVNTLTVTGGKGANTATGGTGGNLSLTAGAGGNGATTNGNGGNVSLSGGAAGTGAGAAGAVGYVLLQSGGGNVGIGTASPGQVLDVQGGNINTSGNVMTGGTQRLSSAGVLSNITGYTQSSGNFSHTGGTHTITSTTATGNVFSVSDTSLTGSGANLANFAAGNNNTAGAGVAVNNVNISSTNVAPASGTNTVNALNLASVTAAANQAFNAINVGTGYNDILRYNNTQLISGTGFVQNAAFDSSVTYSNIANLSNITTGTINSQTISSAANFTGTVTVQGANSLTVGTTGTNTGSILFKGSTAASGTITLIGQNNPGTHTVTLPNETGTLCIQGSTSCGFISTSNALLKNAHDTSSASYVGNLYDFTNSNSGAAGVLSLANSGTNSALSVTQSGNPSAGQALIFANNTNGTPSGNLLDLQAGSVSKLSVSVAGTVTAAGNLVVTGTYNTNTFNSNTLTFGAASTAVISSAASQSLNITSNGASTFQTTSGDITLQSAGGNIVAGSNTTTLFKSATAFTIDLNNASTSKLTVTNSGTGAGVLSVETGFQINGANATSGTYLRGDGTNFVASTIQAADVPDLGASYIKNGTGIQTTANFAIQSAAAGSVGGIIRAAASQTADTFQIQASGSAVRLGVGAGDYTDTSGSKTFLSVAPSFAPTATSTANFFAASIQPTINFSNATPGAGNTTALLVNPTYTNAPTGTNLVADFQVGGSSKVNINSAGKLTVTGGGIDNTSGGITNTGSITGVGANITATGATTLASGAGTALTITGNAASTFGTSAGNLTLSGGAQVVLQSGGTSSVVVRAGSSALIMDGSNAAQAFGTFSQTAGSTNSKALTVATGDASGASSTSGDLVLATGASAVGSGNVSIDTGAATSGTAGQILFGTTNASILDIGRSAAQLLVKGASSNSSIAVSNGGNTTTITFTNPTAARSIVFPDAGGTVCTTTASTCSSTYLTAGNFLSRTAPDTASSSAISASSYLYTFTNANSTNLNSGVLRLTSTNATTNSTLSVNSPGNPSSGQAIIFASNTNASPSGNLIDLQSGSSPTSKFSVSSAGAVIQASSLTIQANGASITGGLNNNTGAITNAGSITGVGANITGTGAVTLASGAATALTVTSNAGATWSTTAGDLTIQAGSGILNVGTSTTIFKSGTALTVDLNSGSNSTLTVTNSGAGTGSLSVETGYQIGGAAASGNYLRGNGTNFVASTIQAGDIPSLSGTYLRNVPAATSDNTVTPTAASVVGLTVNGTSGTAATALAVNQTGNASSLVVTASSNATASDVVRVSNAIFNPTAGTTNAGLALTYSSASTAGVASQTTVTGIMLNPTMNVSNGLAVGTHNLLGINLGTVTNTACAAGSCNRHAIFAPINNNWDSLLTYNSTISINNTGQHNLDSVFNILDVPNGGTGVASATAYALQAGGTTSTGPHQSLTTGTSGQVLISGGNAALPTWQNATAANTCSDCIIQVPLTTARNTVTPTANSVVGLTVNGTSGTAATTAIFNQGGAADNVQVASNNTGTQTNSLVVSRNNAGGTTTNAISVVNSAGTMTNGLIFTGTITNDITAAAGRGLTVVGNGASTISTTAGLLTVQGSTSGLTLTTATTGVVTLDSGTTGAVNIGNNANAKTVTIGNTTGATAVTIQAGTGAINIGNDGIAKTLNIGNATGATALNLNSGTGGINLGDNAITQTIDIGGVTNSGTDTINIATNATAADQVNIGSTNATSKTTLNGGANSTANTNGVQIGGGTSTTDTSQVNLILDNADVSSETANSCTASVNAGAIYYNTATNSIRGCVNARWTDLVTSSDMGLQAFGVVPDSGSQPGDLVPVSGANNGPCKVTKNAGNQVTVSPCTAYSGGRKVVVGSTILTVTTQASATNFQWLCLTGTDGAPELSAISSGRTANQPTFSASAPIVCLAQVEADGGLLNLTPNITEIADVRPFSTAAMTAINIASGTAPTHGMLVELTSTAGQFNVTNATTDAIAGVIVSVGSAALSANTINAIIATSGPVNIRTASGTAGQYITPTTAGLGVGQAGASTTAYNNAGIAQSSFSTTCGTNQDTCRGHLFTILNIK